MPDLPVLCPVAGKSGRRVVPDTLRSLVRDGRLPLLEGSEWYFCDLPDCDVVYFSADGRLLLKGDLKVRVGAKEKTAPRPVCYCFGHTVESIREEIERTGRSTAVASIKARVEAGECHCATMNPKGTCCLGDVSKAIQEAFAARGDRGPAPAPCPVVEEPPHRHDCCATSERMPQGETFGAERAGLLAAGASVLSALMASACCWLPLVLVAFGTSAAGASAAFGRLRPIFLGIAPLALGLGFYVAYSRKAACVPGSACAMPNPKLKRFNRAMLWVATAVVAAVALLPNYAGLLLRRTPPPTADAVTGPVETVTLRIAGMTCEACAGHLESELAAVPGVRAVTVSYAEGRATITIDAGAAAPAPSTLVAAVTQAGYSAEAESPVRTDIEHR